MSQNTEKKQLTWDDIADYIVGKDRTEAIGTGATIIGVGLATKGVIMGDAEDIVEGSVIGGAGLIARIGRPVYRAVQNWRANRAEKPVEPKITKEEAEGQLKAVEAAQTDDPKAEVLKKSALELGLSADRWVQLCAKAKSGHINKPDCQLFNAVCKHAELVCAS